VARFCHYAGLEVPVTTYHDCVSWARWGDERVNRKDGIMMRRCISGKSQTFLSIKGKH
jgi:hypothetical protein